MLKVSFISLIMSQSHIPTVSLFYSLVLPCIVNIEHPAFSIIFANSSVFYLLGSILILHVTGISSSSCNFLTKDSINSGSFNKNEP
jgi:hypothetical protein